MSRPVYYCTLIVIACIVLIATISSPEILSDRNAFLRDFVSNELLEILAVIVSITLASTSSLHLELNRMEERAGLVAFRATRAGIRQAAYWLIALFASSIVLVVAKKGLPLDDHGQSLANGTAIFILSWNLMLLLTITRTVFRISPRLPDEGER